MGKSSVVLIAFASLGGLALESGAAETRRELRRAAPPVLRHRILTNFAADSEGLTSLRTTVRFTSATFTSVGVRISSAATRKSEPIRV